MNFKKYYYYILAPSVQTNDENLDYYYDFSQSIEEYKKVFDTLQCQWKWQPVTINNYKEIIQQIVNENNGFIPFVLNLCDGDDVNDVPGVNVIYELEKYDVQYSGADAFFYTITTSKIPMKKAFDANQVPNAKWMVIKNEDEKVFATLKAPILIKPAVSGGSMGVSVKNVVHNDKEFRERVMELQNGYRGWNLMVDGLFAEEFIVGEEYTTFIIGSYTNPNECVIYEPVHRIFHHSLPKEEKFLSFDRLWEIYEDEKEMPNNENFYEYGEVKDKALTQQLKQLTLDAYISCKGIGYGRLDFRVDECGNIFCLEVNAQCGLSEDENYTSIGAIIKASNTSFTVVIENIIKETIRRVKPILV